MRTANKIFNIIYTTEASGVESLTQTVMGLNEAGFKIYNIALVSEIYTIKYTK